MFAVGVSLLKGPPKCSAEVLPGVFKYKKAAMCLIEKISLSDKLYLGKSYSAIGFEFNEMNKPYTQSKMTLNRNAYKATLLYGLVDKNPVTKSNKRLTET